MPELYLPLADRWKVFDNSGEKRKLIAAKEEGEIQIFEDATWQQILK